MTDATPADGPALDAVIEAARAIAATVREMITFPTGTSAALSRSAWEKVTAKAKAIDVALSRLADGPATTPAAAPTPEPFAVDAAAPPDDLLRRVEALRPLVERATPSRVRTADITVFGPVDGTNERHSEESYFRLVAMQGDERHQYLFSHGAAEALCDALLGLLFHNRELIAPQSPAPPLDDRDRIADQAAEIERLRGLDWRLIDDWAKQQPAVFVHGGLARWIFDAWHSLMLGGETRARPIQWDVTEYAPVPHLSAAYERAQIAHTQLGEAR